MNPGILIVCGATASGKSAYALDIAQNNHGVIINADAMQIYRELRILTARPTPEQERLARHQLYGVIPASEKCSVARWLSLAQTAIDEAMSDKMLPIVTGGTGLYIKALMEGLSPIPGIPDEFRLQATKLWREQRENALKERDKSMAERLKAGDTQRHIRALEVLLATGKSLSYWQEIPRIKPYPKARFEVKYIQIPRAELYQRCDERFLAMIKAGAIEEARTLYEMHLPDDMPAIRAVGVKEFFNYFKGVYGLEETVKRTQQATRNYAKRQITWFGNQLLLQ